MKTEATGGLDRRRPIAMLALLVLACAQARGQTCPEGLAGARTYLVDGDVVPVDVDGDGDVDLALSGSVLPNIGDGRFGTPAPLALPGATGAVTSADLDGTGTADLAFAAVQANAVYVIAGNGDGTFQAAAILALPAEPLDVTHGDFDRDGVLDLATANADGTVTILLGLGGGLFGPPATYPGGTRLTTLAAADLDGDGAPEIVATDYQRAELVYLPNRGDGTFGTPWVYALSSRGTSVGLDRLDADGIPDATVATATGLDVLLGRPGGGLGAATTHGSSGTYGVATVDMDGDGDIDVLARAHGYLDVYSGDGAGTLHLAARYALGWWGSVASADLNGDGLADVASSANGAGAITVFLGTGGGQLLAAPFNDPIPSPNWPYHAAFTDLDGDGLDDFAVANDDYAEGLTIALNDGHGGYFERIRYPAYRGDKAIAGDWNLDGRQDLVIAYGTSYGGDPRLLLLGNGDGTFRSGPPLPSWSAYRLFAADVDGDGALDLASSDRYSSLLTIELSNGDGTFQPAFFSYLGATLEDWLTLDVTNDGYADVAVLVAGGSNVTVFEGNGDGTFQAGAGYPIPGSAAVALHAADVNGDGAVDLVGAGTDVSVLLGTGAGSFSPGSVTPISWPVGPEALVGIGDIDGDGILDLAIPAYWALVFLRGRADGSFSDAGAYHATAWEVHATDVDRDGRTDLVEPDRLSILRALGVAITPANLPDGATGTPYAQTLLASGGSAPYAFTIVSGALPRGLSLAASGVLSGVPSTAGAFGFTVQAVDAAACTATRAYRLQIAGGASGASLLAGEGLGFPNPNRVKAFHQGGMPTDTDFSAYGAGQWGVSVAAGAVDGGDDRLLTGPGPGPVYGPQVRGFARRGVPLVGLSFFAYGTLRYGVIPGAGDVDGGASQEVLSGPGAGVVFGPHVRGFRYSGSSVSPVAGLSFYAYGTLRYGVGVSAGDVEDDGFQEIATAPGPGPWFGAQVRGFDVDGAAVAAIGRISFYAFPVPGYGASVAAGDGDGDPFAELAAAPGPGPGPPYAPRFVGFDYDGVAIAALPGFDVTTSTGTSYGGRVGLADVTGDGAGDLLTGPGRDPAAGATVRPFVYAASYLTPLHAFDAFFGSSYGVNVAGARLGP